MLLKNTPTYVLRAMIRAVLIGPPTGLTHAIAEEICGRVSTFDEANTLLRDTAAWLPALRELQEILDRPVFYNKTVGDRQRILAQETERLIGPYLHQDLI